MKTITTKIPIIPQEIVPDSQINPITLILSAVKDRIGDVDELKYIGTDWGQLDGYSPNFPVKWPCALIDITHAQYFNLGKNPDMMPINRQQAEISLTITIAALRTTPYNMYDDETSNSGIFYVIQRIHELLHGYAPTTNTGALIRQSMQRIRRTDGVLQYSISYATTLYNV